MVPSGKEKVVVRPHLDLCTCMHLVCPSYLASVTPELEHQMTFSACEDAGFLS